MIEVSLEVEKGLQQAIIKNHNVLLDFLENNQYLNEKAQLEQHNQD